MKNFTIKYTLTIGTETLNRTTGFISESKESAISELKAMYTGVFNIISVRSSALLDKVEM
jgi:hypothetical protein